MQSCIIVVFSHMRVTSASVMYPMFHIKRTTRIIRIASLFNSRTESSIIKSFIRPAGPIVAKTPQNQWRGEAKKIHGVVTSCASSPPLTPHSEQGLCPLNFHQASYEFEAFRELRMVLSGHIRRQLCLLNRRRIMIGFICQPLRLKDVLISEAIVIHSRHAPCCRGAKLIIFGQSPEDLNAGNRSI